MLIPWKSRVARAGLRRARLSRWLSLLLAALALVTLGAGLAYATGWLRWVAGETGLYYDNSRRKQPSRHATAALATELWQRSEAWVA